MAIDYATEIELISEAIRANINRKGTFSVQMPGGRMLQNVSINSLIEARDKLITRLERTTGSGLGIIQGVAQRQGGG